MQIILHFWGLSAYIWKLQKKNAEIFAHVR